VLDPTRDRTSLSLDHSIRHIPGYYYIYPTTRTTLRGVKHLRSSYAYLTMRFIVTSALLVSAVIGSAVPTANKKVDYSGYKLMRLSSSEDLESKLEEIAAHVLNPGKSGHLDVVVSPDKVAEVTSLVTDSKVISEDVGAIIAEEGEMGSYAGK
jgi:hypothetical protein